MKKLHKELLKLDISNPKEIDLVSDIKEVEECKAIINKLIKKINTNKKAKEFLTDELSRSQVNLLEAQKLANIGSWEYVIGENKFITSIQVHRLLGITPKEALSWEQFIDFIEFNDRDTFKYPTRDI